MQDVQNFGCIYNAVCCFSGATTHFDPVMLFGYFYLNFQYKWPHLDFFFRNTYIYCKQCHPLSDFGCFGFNSHLRQYFNLQCISGCLQERGRKKREMISEKMSRQPHPQLLKVPCYGTLSVSGSRCLLWHFQH